MKNSHSDDDKLKKYFDNLGIKGVTSERLHAMDCDKYVLKEDEHLSDDFDAIICNRCGGVRYVKTYSSFFGRWRWETQQCECRRLEIWQANVDKDKEAWPRIIKRSYDEPDYLSPCVGNALKDIKWDDPTFTGPNQHESFVSAKNALKRFCLKYDDLTERKLGFYLYSPTRGNGKTTLACMVRNELLNMGIPCVVTTLERLSSVKIENPTLFYKMTTVRCLIIDDIGVNKFSDWKNQLLYDVLSARSADVNSEEDKYITCFTSNYKIDELTKSECSTANISRIQGCAGAVLKIDSPSMRGMR